MNGMKMPKLSVLVASCVSAALLTACGGTEDLQQFVVEVGNRPHPQIPELPVVNDYVPASFTPASDRSPFVRPRAELPQITQSFHEEGCDDITALVSRTVKDSLEHYSLDNLIMKGTYRDGAGQLWGIVQVGAHSVQNQKVKVGSYMGLNMGRVTAITPEAIQLDEYVQEKPGCYKKKSTKIELNVADKRN